MGIFFNIEGITECISSNYDFENIIVGEQGGLLTLRILPMIVKNMISTKGYDYEYMKNEYMPKIVSKCKSVDDVKYLKKDRNMAKSQLAAMLKNIENYNKDPENSFKTLGKSFRKAIDKGEISEKTVKDYIHFIEVDYLKLLNEKEKELKNK